MTTPYEKDFYQWSLEQANYLRLGDIAKLDIDHLVEEIETLGNSDKRAMVSYFTVILIHMLKMKYQPEKKTRSWELSIKAARIKANRLLKHNPSFKRFLEEWREDSYEDAILVAAQETGLDEKIFIKECPWILNEILGNK